MHTANIAKGINSRADAIIVVASEVDPLSTLPTFISTLRDFIKTLLKSMCIQFNPKSRWIKRNRKDVSAFAGFWLAALLPRCR